MQWGKESAFLQEITPRKSGLYALVLGVVITRFGFLLSGSGYANVELARRDGHLAVRAVNRIQKNFRWSLASRSQNWRAVCEMAPGRS